MPLPFLKNKKVAGLIMEYRKPDGTGEQEPEDQQDQGLIACSEAIIRAVHAKDSQSLSKALQDAFQVMENTPHEEAPEMPEDGDSE